MSKILILYTSKYGSTARYAELIKESLIEEGAEVTLSPLKGYKGSIKGYDTIIYGAGIKSCKLYGYDKFAKKIKKLDRIQTTVAVYAVGMLSADRSYAQRLVKINNVDDDIKFFYLRGAIDLNKLKGFDGSIVKRLVRTLMIRDDLTPDEKAFVAACLHSKDWVNKENVERIVEYAK